MRKFFDWMPLNRCSFILALLYCYSLLLTINKWANVHIYMLLLLYSTKIVLKRL